MDREPTTVDPLLAAAAERLARAHGPDPERLGRCRHRRCRSAYPCQAALLAAEATEQAGPRTRPTTPALAGTGEMSWR